MYNRRLKVKFDMLSVQFQYSSVTQSCLTWWPHGLLTPGLPVHHQLPELAQTHVYQVGGAVQPSHPLYHPLLLLPSIFPSIRIFSCESILPIRWPKYWSFSFSISPSNEYPWLTSFRIDGFEIHAVHGTLKSLLQHHSSKSFNSSALSFLYGPALTSIHANWKNHSFD